jgi:uncharacterized protein YecE (DUF72 family)
MNAGEKIVTGYAPKDLDQWSRRVSKWADGKAPDDLPRVEDGPGGKLKPKEVFLFFINGAKERAPAAAGALLERLGWAPSEEVPVKATVAKAAKAAKAAKTAASEAPAAKPASARKTSARKAA